MDAENRAVDKPYVFAVCGVKNSGKTTYLERLIAELKGRCIRLAVIKHDGHEFEADVPGTDSSRLYRAGADGVAVYSQSQMMVHRRGRVPLGMLVSQFMDCELVLVEGGKDEELDKIELVRSGNSRAAVSNPKGRIGIATDIVGFERPGEGEYVCSLDNVKPVADWICMRLRGSADRG